MYISWLLYPLRVAFINIILPWKEELEIVVSKVIFMYLSWWYFSIFIYVYVCEIFSLFLLVFHFLSFWHFLSKKNSYILLKEKNNKLHSTLWQTWKKIRNTFSNIYLTFVFIEIKNNLFVLGYIIILYLYGFTFTLNSLNAFAK